MTVSGEVTLDPDGLADTLTRIFIAAGGIRDGRLEVILPRYHLESAGMSLVYPPGRYLSGRVRAFSDHMVKHFQAKAPWADCPRGAQPEASARAD